MQTGGTAAAGDHTLEFWLDLASNYTYLSVMRIEAESQRRGVDIVWKPFLLGPIFRDMGWSGPVFVVQAEKGRYVWRDMERQCAKYRIPWQRPSEFPRDTLLATRVALLGAREPWIGAFCRAVMERNFGDDKPVGSPEAVSAILGELGLDATPLLSRATETETKQALRDQTAEARARGVFGAPTFFVGEEMFWGNDRLGDALELAANAASARFPGTTGGDAE